MTRYVMTRSDVGEIPARTIGRVGSVDAASMRITVLFNDGAGCWLDPEAFRLWLFELRPKAWKADLYRTGMGLWRRVVLPADPVTFDPPAQWRVPISVAPRDMFVSGAAMPSSTMEVLTFDRVRIPEASDVWTYREAVS